MSALTFTLRHAPDQRLDVSSLIPQRLANMSEAEITALPVHTTKIKASVGDHFRISGNDAENLRIIGGSPRLDGIASEMASGTILVDGEAGSRAGRLMSGGTLIVKGTTGPWTGSGLKGGKITVEGDAGDWLGGPLAGELAGMRGGTILVHGSAGNEAAHRLRRGLIVIGGDAGDYAARAMLAGTLVIQGKAGAYPGYLMRRGTLILSRRPKQLSPTFQDCGTCDLAFLRLLERHLAEVAPKLRFKLGNAMRRHAGDLAALGKGELFVTA